MEAKEVPTVSMPVGNQSKAASMDREDPEKIYEDLKSTLTYLTCHFTMEGCIEDFLFELGTIAKAVIEIEINLPRKDQ